LLPGFAQTRREGADGVRLQVRVGGEGPPVVLLHGHPRTPGPPAGTRRELARGGGKRVLSLRGGGRIDSGHHVAEEAPEELVAALVPSLAASQRADGGGNPA
jgi:haloacetate dehalogenase